MGEALNEEELRALRACPINGFPLGSNMWPFVFAEHVTPPIDGEVFDQLLRRGYLVAAPLPEPIMSDRSPNPEIVPDCEVTHAIQLTAEGAAALTINFNTIGGSTYGQTRAEKDHHEARDQRQALSPATGSDGAFHADT